MNKGPQNSKKEPTIEARLNQIRKTILEDIYTGDDLLGLIDIMEYLLREIQELEGRMKSIEREVYS